MYSPIPDPEKVDANPLTLKKRVKTFSMSSDGIPIPKSVTLIIAFS
jgi:hypothetical protein